MSILLFTVQNDKVIRRRVRVLSKDTFFRSDFQGDTKMVIGFSQNLKPVNFGVFVGFSF